MLNYYIKSNLLFTDKVKVFVRISHAMNLLLIQNLNGVTTTMYWPFHRKKMMKIVPKLSVGKPPTD